MSASGCCESTSTPPRSRHKLDVAGYAVPVAVMALLPKCPACIVAYLAMGAGIGVTVSTAAQLRIVVLALCVAVLAYVTARRVKRSV